ncbi:ABC transporter permease [Microbacterium sediminicola]|uniref:ABC transporter permease n=1 Tax=Microbacterium sediminicola TaxID=415210 RepID=A0ABN2IJ11_9MICO
MATTPTIKDRLLSRRIIAPGILLVVALVLWQLASTFLVEPSKSFLLPSPVTVVQDGFMNSIILEEIAVGTWNTVVIAVVGFTVAAILAIAIAVLMNLADWLEATIFPYAILVQTIPILAIVPLVGFWVGFNFASRVLVCVIIAFFPIVTNTLFGLKSADPLLHNLLTIAGASRTTRLFKLEFPSALPAMFTGFRISAGAAVVGAIVADYFFRSGSPGLGRLLQTYLNNLQSAALFAAVGVSVLLGVLVFWIVGWAERAATGKWSTSVRAMA